ncbi:MAG: NADP-dependent oxidoreductase [Flavobacteriaceae bacterium]
MKNTRICLAERPVGLPSAGTWTYQSVPVEPLKEGEILIKQHYISLDPAMRGWIRAGKSYIPPVEIGEVMRAGTVGEVIYVNNNSHFEVGDFVSGAGGVQEYTCTDGRGFYKVNPKQAPLTTYLGALGMPGMTAYFGILEVGKIKSGDVVLVSGAAGAVGSLVGQIAKIKGCRVVGIAGGASKCKYVVEELGFDAAIDYKNENLMEALKTHCPEGIDVYFDNVGGDILDAALLKLRIHARVVICGAISQYNASAAMKGPSNYLSLLVNRATMQGMVVFDYADRYLEGMAQMGSWLADGSIKTREDVYEGLENFNNTLLRLFSGEKIGKLVLKVNKD